MYSQQSASAAASLNMQSAANYQISQQTAALQQQAAAAAAAALQQVSWYNVALYSAVLKVLEIWHECTHSESTLFTFQQLQHLLAKDHKVLVSF